MSEKQYSLVYYADKGGAFIKNNETGTEWYHDSRASLLEIVNELNGLVEEKEICKQAYREIKEDAIKKAEENEELKQGIIDYSQYLTDKSTKLEEENNELKSKCEFMETIIENKGYSVDFDVAKGRWVVE